MAELKTLVEREMDRAGSPSYSFVDLARRRDRKQRNRRIGTAVLALVLAAVAIGGAVRAFRGAEAPRPANLPSTTDAWSRVVLDRGQWVEAITPGGPGLVAVGNEHRYAVAWTSSDGRSWTRVSEEQLGPGRMRDVAVGGPGLVAVGRGTDSRAPVWTSTDGLTWTRIPYDPIFRRASLTAVTAGGPGLVAVGYTFWASSEDGPQAWYSSDGATWELASVPPMPPGVAVYEGQANAWMQDVAAVGDRLVAVGQIGIGHYNKDGTGRVRYDLAIWTSTDGMRWTEVPLDPDVFPRISTVSSLAAGPDGLVAVGTYRDVVGGGLLEEPGVWISTDGLDWRRVRPEQDAFVSRWPSGVNAQGSDVDLAMLAVTAGSGGYVAVGGDGVCPGGVCPSAEAAVWTSSDGESWTRVPTGPVFQMSSDDSEQKGWVLAGVIAWGSRFVAWGAYDKGTAVLISDPSKA